MDDMLAAFSVNERPKNGMPRINFSIRTPDFTHVFASSFCNKTVLVYRRAEWYQLNDSQ